MTKAIAISGVRQFGGVSEKGREQARQVRLELEAIEAEVWHVGDADGVDQLARALAPSGDRLKVYYKNPELPHRAQGAERSTRMIKALALAGGTLHAWVNKPAPYGLKPGKSWGRAQGSGTWGTVALAVGHGLQVELHPLTEDAIAPDWLNQHWLKLQ